MFFGVSPDDPYGCEEGGECDGFYVRSHIWLIDGRMGLMPRRFCSAASCRDVMPAHTPCMSMGWYSRA